MSYARTMTEADLVNYTNLAGLKLPLFIDVESAAAQDVLGARVPGLCTASVAAGMLEDILGKYTLAALGSGQTPGAGYAPVKIGDTLHAEITVECLKDTKDGKRGVITVRIKVKNQKGETPLEFWGSFMMRKGELQ